MTQAVVLDRLTDSAKGALAELASLLASGFTGKIELDCSQGAVNNFRQTISRKGADLAPRTASR